MRRNDEKKWLATCKLRHKLRQTVRSGASCYRVPMLIILFSAGRITYLTEHSLAEQKAWYNGSGNVLDCMSTGQAVDAAPGA